MTARIKSILTATQYKYFMMRKKGMSPIDISEKVGTCRNSVNSTLSHAARRLKKNGVDYELPPTKYGWKQAFRDYNERKKPYCFDYASPNSLKVLAHRKGIKMPVSPKIVDRLIAVQEPKVMPPRIETAAQWNARRMKRFQWQRGEMVRV